MENYRLNKKFHLSMNVLSSIIVKFRFVFFLLTLSATAQNFNPLPDTIIHCSINSYNLIIPISLPIIWENGDTSHVRNLYTSGLYQVRNLISQEKDSVFFINYSQLVSQTLDSSCNRTIELKPNCGVLSLSEGLLSFIDFNDTIEDFISSNQVVSFNVAKSAGLNGRPNGSAQFNGTSSYIQTNVSGNQLPLTLTSFIKPSNLNGEHSIIDCDIQGQFGHSLIIGYWANGFPLSNFGDQTIDVQFHDGYFNSLITINLNEWTHVATTIDSSEIKLFINGSLVASTNYVFQGSFDGTNFRIGRHNNIDPQWYQGEIDNAGIWNRELCEEEIRLLAQGFRPQNITTTLNGINSSLIVPNDSIVERIIQVDGITICTDTIYSIQYNRPTLGALNTGKNTLSSGGAATLDSTWSVSMSKTGSFNPATLVTIPTGVWYNSPWPDTEWISINMTGTQNVSNDTVYYFKTEFDLPCKNECEYNMADSGSFCLDLEMFADNVVRSVYLNGINIDAKIGLPIPNQYSHTGYISTGKQELYICEGWQPGPNELIIEVWTSPYAVGLLVQANQNYLNPNYTRDTIVITGCDSVIYEEITYNKDTIFFDQLNSTKCHSTYVELGINQPSTQFTQIQGCHFLFVNNDSIFTSIVDTIYLLNKYGCDSTIIRDLIINPIDTIHTYLSNCDTLIYNSILISKDTTIFANFNSLTGCDSTNATHITIFPSKDTIIQVFSCDSIRIGNITFLTDTSFLSTYIASNGCDSNVTNQIFIKNSIIVNDIINSCLPIYINGSIISSDTTITSQYMNIHNCDSTFVLRVNIHQRDSIYTTQTFCDSIIFNGIVYYSDTLVTTIFSNSNNCDSVLFFNLVRNLSKQVTVNLISCDSIFYDGILFNNDSTYTKAFNISSGCDSTVQYVIDINPTSMDTITFYVCDSIIFSGSSFWVGLHNITYTNISNCDSTVILNIVEDSTRLHSEREVKFCELDLPFYLISYPNFQFQNGQDSLLINSNVVQNNSVVELKFNGKCVDTLLTHLSISDTCDYSIYIPNSFTPNNDVVNDNFRIGILGIIQIQFIIFDRWGNLIYESSELDFNWDGTYTDGQLAPQGVYTFRGFFLSHSGKEIFKNGTITLIR